jgi:hypothetical protein
MAGTWQGGSFCFITITPFLCRLVAPLSIAIWWQ